MIACRSPIAPCPPSMGVSAPNGYGPGSLSLGYWNVTFTFGWPGATTGYGMPSTVGAPGPPKVNVTFQYPSESDPGPYPFGADTPIEGGQGATGDRHAIMIDPTTCTLYELYDAHYSAGSSTAGSGA